MQYGSCNSKKNGVDVQVKEFKEKLDGLRQSLELLNVIDGEEFLKSITIEEQDKIAEVEKILKRVWEVVEWKNHWWFKK